jgi:hypothetical protein
MLNRREVMKGFASGVLASAIPGARAATPSGPDVLIYGGTPAGLAAARAIVRHGGSVAVIEPTTSVGGMITGGIAVTDTGTPDLVGGISREFFEAAYIETQRTVSWQEPPQMSFRGVPVPWHQFARWDLEPKTASTVFNSWVHQGGYPLRFDRRVVSVHRAGSRIDAIRLSDGTVHSARIFIDASYEGDLMALAGVSNTYGREAVSEYDESLAGVRFPYFLRDYEPEYYSVPGSDYMHLGQFGAEISARGAEGRLLPGVEPTSSALIGSADRRLQAFCYRLIATQRKDLLVPWPKPANYASDQFEVLLRYVQAHPDISFARLVHLAPIPNGKWDLNASGPFSIDFIGGNKGFVEGSYDSRQKILQQHVDYEQGFLWFLAHDPRVPAILREEVNSWGLCSDEYPDTGHWPVQIYTRETRRMVGDFVMTERDVLTDKSKEDAVGLGSFVIDCHWVRRFENEQGFIRVEGHLDETINLAKHPYEIPYRTLTPRKSECTNLLVPVCVSASHVGICTLRLEPIYMILGHTAGIAAGMALKSKVAVQDIEIPALQRQLLTEGQILRRPDSRQ